MDIQKQDQVGDNQSGGGGCGSNQNNSAGGLNGILTVSVLQAACKLTTAPSNHSRQRLHCPTDAKIYQDHSR
jgi:hypothetical protein